MAIKLLPGKVYLRNTKNGRVYEYERNLADLDGFEQFTAEAVAYDNPVDDPPAEEEPVEELDVDTPPPAEDTPPPPPKPAPPKPAPAPPKKPTPAAPAKPKGK